MADEEQKIAPTPEGGEAEDQVNTPPVEAEDEDDVTNNDGGELEARESGPSPEMLLMAERARADAAERRYQEERTERERATTSAREREMLALMSPEEKISYENNKFRQETQASINAQLQSMQLMNAEASDRAAYAMKAATTEVYRKFSSEVESRFEKLKAQGRPTAREYILRDLLGEKALKAAEKGGISKSKKAADANISKAKTSGTKTRSDVKSGGPELSERAARMERLRNTNLRGQTLN